MIVNIYNWEEVEKRLLKYRKIVDNHWLWVGHLDKSGHGQVGIGGKSYFPSRLSAMLYLGLDINDQNQQANHKLDCEYKNCFNPRCLYVGTQLENNRDSAINKTTKNQHTSQTHCKNGHALSERNLIVTYDKLGIIHRNCRICKNEYSRKWQMRKRVERMR